MPRGRGAEGGPSGVRRALTSQVNKQTHLLRPADIISPPRQHILGKKDVDDARAQQLCSRPRISRAPAARGQFLVPLSATAHALTHHDPTPSNLKRSACKARVPACGSLRPAPPAPTAQQPSEPFTCQVTLPQRRPLPVADLARAHLYITASDSKPLPSPGPSHNGRSCTHWVPRTPTGGRVARDVLWGRDAGDVLWGP
jgi:hypothetical protein